MWTMLLSGGVIPAYEASSTRLGFVIQPPTSISVSSTRLGVILHTPPGIVTSSTRIGLILRSKT